MRALAMLLTFVVGGAPLLSAAHLAAVQHATCEHGESIEVADSDGHQHAGSCIREAAGHAHEHCSILAHRDVRALSGGDEEVATVSLLTLVRLPDATAPPQIAVLAHAPKTSPPA